jgi:hypothetical protein
MQGSSEALSGFAAEFGCVPLATRDIRVPKKGEALKATLVMVAAVAAAALGLVPVAVSFATGVLALMALRIVSLRSVYKAVDWPVIVLLGAMLPVAGAMASTGAADLIAGFLLDHCGSGSCCAWPGRDSGGDHAHDRFHEQRGHSRSDVSRCPEHCGPTAGQSGLLSDGRGYWRFLCLSHPHRPPEQHAYPWPRRFSLSVITGEWVCPWMYWLSASPCRRFSGSGRYNRSTEKSALAGTSGKVPQPWREGNA